MQRHVSDPYVQASKRDGYRSRASYKLLELQDKYKLLKKGMKVVDLGAAPGGWSQVANELISPSGQVWALDLLPIAPIPRVHCIQGDFNDEKIHQLLADTMGEDTTVDWVLSDLAPNLSGIRDLDEARSLELLEMVWEFASKHLKNKGGMLVKVFEGNEAQQYIKRVKQHFDQVLIRKPLASRAESKEIYMLARGYNI